MSETLNVAFVAEGVTDYWVLYATIETMVGDRTFNLNLLQPETNLAFAGPFGGDVNPNAERPSS